MPSQDFKIDSQADTGMLRQMYAISNNYSSMYITVTIIPSPRKVVMAHARPLGKLKVGVPKIWGVPNRKPGDLPYTLERSLFYIR